MDIGCLLVINCRQPPFFLFLVPVGLLSWEPRLSELFSSTNAYWALMLREVLQKFQDAWTTAPAVLITLWSGRKSHEQIITPTSRMCNRRENTSLGSQEGKTFNGRNQGGVLSHVSLEFAILNKMESGSKKMVYFNTAKRTCLKVCSSVNFNTDIEFNTYILPQSGHRTI